jgi:hypothetical protein
LLVEITTDRTAQRLWYPNTALGACDSESGRGLYATAWQLVFRTAHRMLFQQCVERKLAQSHGRSQADKSVGCRHIMSHRIEGCFRRISKVDGFNSISENSMIELSQEYWAVRGTVFKSGVNQEAL